MDDLGEKCPDGGVRLRFQANQVARDFLETVCEGLRSAKPSAVRPEFCAALS